MADSNVSDEMKQCYENLIVIDCGANLTNKKYSRDLDSVVQRAQDAGNYEFENFCKNEYWMPTHLVRFAFWEHLVL